ncbi:hypothetical protein RYX36_024165, partial [Vicia faba]
CFKTRLTSHHFSSFSKTIKRNYKSNTSNLKHNVERRVELIPDRRRPHRNTRFGICIGDLLWWWRLHVSRGVVEGVGEGLIEAEWVDGDGERLDGFEVNSGFMRQRMNMNMELYHGYHYKRTRVERSTNFRDLFNALSFILQPAKKKFLFL